MKKSLAISDEEKYGASSPMTALSGKDTKKSKSVPTIELTGPQVDAFCACDLKVGDTGTATVHYVVKAMSAGDSYGNQLPTGDSKKKVTLALSHVESEGDGEDEEEKDDETPDEESDEQSDDPKEKASESDSEGGAEEPAVSTKKAVGVKDTGLDND